MKSRRAIIRIVLLMLCTLAVGCDDPFNDDPFSSASNPCQDLNTLFQQYAEEHWEAYKDAVKKYPIKSDMPSEAEKEFTDDVVGRNNLVKELYQKASQIPGCSFDQDTVDAYQAAEDAWFDLLNHVHSDEPDSPVFPEPHYG